MSNDVAQTAEPPRDRIVRPHTYDAFLSYSRADEAVANGLQQGLHRIGRRPGQLHALRVFRDKTDLHASPDLWGRITDALDASRYLIVVLSPHAATSPWVDRELSYWLQEYGPDRAQFVLADGTLDWDDEQRRFHPEHSSAAPPTLTQPGVLGAEPIYVDVSTDAPWDAHTATFRNKVTDLAAPIHGKSKYELASDDVREQRRFRMLRRLAIAGLTLLTVLAVVAAAVAVVQRNEADRQRATVARQERAAVKQRDDAIALKLMAEGESILAGVRAGGDVRALQQLLAAYRIDRTHTDGGLLHAVVSRSTTRKLIGTNGTGFVDTSFNSARTLFATGAGNSVVLWDTRSGRVFGPPLNGHTGLVSATKFSADGRRLVSMSEGDQTVRVWDVDTGRQLISPLRWPEAGTRPTHVAMNGDGSRVAVVDSHYVVEIWEVDPITKKGNAIARIEPPHALMMPLAFSPDGGRLAIAGKTIEVFDVDTGQPAGKPFGTGIQTDIAFSPDGRRLVTAGGDDQSAQVWDAATGEPIGRPLSGHTDWVSSAAFSPDGRRIVTGSWDDTVRVWDAATGEQLGAPLVGHTSDVALTAFESNERVVSASDDGMVRVWDVGAGGRLDRVLRGHTDNVSGVAFSPDGKRVVSASWDKTVRMWDTATGEQIGPPLVGHLTDVNSVAFSPDGSRIVTGGGSLTDESDNSIRLWDNATGRQLGTPLLGHEAAVYSVAFSPDGKQLVSGGGDQTVRIWDVATGKQVGSPLTGHSGNVYGVAFSPDGKRVVSGSGDTSVRIWDVESGAELGDPLEGHTDGVTSVAFSPFGDQVMSAGWDHTIRLWNVGNGEQAGPVWRVDSQVPRAVVFSADGFRVVSGGGEGDNALRVWSLDTAAQLGAPLVGHEDDVRSVAISSDGRMIASGGDDDTVRLWPGPAVWPELLCDKLTTNMSDEQWREWVSPDIPYLEQCPGLPKAG